MISDSHSGTSCHLLKNAEGSEDTKVIGGKADGIGQNQMHVIMKGKAQRAFKQADGTTPVERTMYPGKYMKGLQEDLFSILIETQLFPYQYAERCRR